MSAITRPAAELDELGYTLLPNWVPADLLAELRATVARLYAIEGEKAGSEFRQEPGCLRLANLVDKGAVFQRVIAAPELLALVAHVIGPEFKLSSLNCRTALPGCAPQPLHADMGGVADGHGAWVCNIIWMLDAYTPDNGPVRVVPSSHRWRRLPASELPDLRAHHPAEIAVTAPAGSVVVMNAHTWHGGLDNRTQGHRTALHAFYCRRDKPQQQYQKKLLRPEVQAALPADVRRLLALDDPLNDELANSDVPRSGFLPAPGRPRAF
ncbi:MAG: phytanoyl-CoA dioxygenase family protein [Opitutaceae bacterium]|nr:phytanoyl-CoA dioxygenase family protein [Opitutaceae bacterium]